LSLFYIFYIFCYFVILFFHSLFIYAFVLIFIIIIFIFYILFISLSCLGEGGFGGCVFSKEVAPLLPEFYSAGND